MKRVLLILTLVVFSAATQVNAAPNYTAPYPWNLIGRCEAPSSAPGGINWRYNDGVYEGGLNFAPSTWDTAKKLPSVRRFAARYSAAYNAPPWVQVAVARAWLKVTDWRQWPDCSRRAGLR